MKDLRAAIERPGDREDSVAICGDEEDDAGETRNGSLLYSTPGDMRCASYQLHIDVAIVCRRRFLMRNEVQT